MVPFMLWLREPQTCGLAQFSDVVEAFLRFSEQRAVLWLRAMTKKTGCEGEAEMSCLIHMPTYDSGGVV